MCYNYLNPEKKYIKQITGIKFFKNEYWVFKIMYVVALIAVLTHIYMFFTQKNIKNHYIAFIAYFCLTLFSIRLSAEVWREKE